MFNDTSADDTVTLKELAVALSPIFIGLGLKLAVFGAIRHYARKQLAEMDAIPSEQ